MSKDSRKNSVVSIGQITVDMKCISGIKHNGVVLNVFLKGNARMDTPASNKDYKIFKKKFEEYIKSENETKVLPKINRNFYIKGKRCN